MGSTSLKSFPPEMNSSQMREQLELLALTHPEISSALKNEAHNLSCVSLHSRIEKQQSRMQEIYQGFKA